VPLPSLVQTTRAHRSDSRVAGAPPPSSFASQRHRCCPVTPSLPLEVRNLHAPLISCVLPCSLRNCSPEQASVAVNPPFRVQRPLVLPCRRGGHGRVRQTPLIAPRLVPEPLVTYRGRSPLLRRALAAGPSGATTLKSAPLSLDLGRPPKIGRFRLNNERIGS
jgi:hypothetical protein